MRVPWCTCGSQGTSSSVGSCLPCETRSYYSQMCARLAEPWASGKGPISASPLAAGVLGLQTHLSPLAFHGSWGSTLESSPLGRWQVLYLWGVYPARLTSAMVSVSCCLIGQLCPVFLPRPHYWWDSQTVCILKYEQPWLGHARPGTMLAITTKNCPQPVVFIPV